jgi:hypothetical protein
MLKTEKSFIHCFKFKPCVSAKKLNLVHRIYFFIKPFLAFDLMAIDKIYLFYQISQKTNISAYTFRQLKKLYKNIFKKFRIVE